MKINKLNRVPSLFAVGALAALGCAVSACGGVPLTEEEEVGSLGEAITFNHPGTWFNPIASTGEQMGSSMGYATRKDNSSWRLTTRIANPSHPGAAVFRQVYDQNGSGAGWTNGWHTLEVLPGFNLATIDSSGATAITLHSYLGPTTSGARNVVMGYVGTDGLIHYGQVKSGTATAFPNTFSQNTRNGPSGVTLNTAYRPAFATAGTTGFCASQGAGSTCLYLFVKGTINATGHSAIYFKRVSCPTDGNCSAFTTTTNDWTKIPGSDNMVDTGLAAARVNNDKIMVAGVHGGTGFSWVITASTAAIGATNTIPWPVPNAINLMPATLGFPVALGATSFNRGTGCAQIVGTGGNDHVWSTATCDGINFNAWQDLGLPFSGGIPGTASIAETFPTSSGFNIGFGFSTQPYDLKVLP